MGGFVKGVTNDVPGDTAMGRDVEGVSGVVIEPGDGLGVGAVGQVDVGEVRLPGFVR